MPWAGTLRQPWTAEQVARLLTYRGRGEHLSSLGEPLPVVRFTPKSGRAVSPLKESAMCHKQTFANVMSLGGLFRLRCSWLGRICLLQPRDLAIEIGKVIG